MLLLPPFRSLICSQRRYLQLPATGPCRPINRDNIDGLWRNVTSEDEPKLLKYNDIFLC